jgi:hypothetical protein
MLLRMLLIFCISQWSLADTAATVYPYQFDESSLAGKDFDTLILASQNFGKPSRQYLAPHEEKIDRYVTEYLKSSGYKVLNSRIYAQALSAAEARIGDPFDPTSGKLNQQRKQQVVADVLGQLQASQPTLDGVVFTELLDRQVYFSQGIKRSARWDGVSRPPQLLGADKGAALNFNWAQSVDAVSIAIYIFTIEGQRVLVGVGGMSLTEDIDTRGDGKLKRSRNVLSNEAQVMEGIGLALHPFIPMQGYPQN